MKTILVLLLCVASAVNAEILFGSSNSTTRITVQTNEAIVVLASIGGFNEVSSLGDSGADAVIVTEGKTNVLRLTTGSEFTLDYNPLILAGPMELGVRPSQLDETTNEFGMISFRRIRTTAIKTQLVPLGSNFLISIPSNQFVHFFQRMGNIRSMEITTASGYARLRIRDGAEFEGPATIRITAGTTNDYPYPGTVGAVTYFIGQDSMALPNLGMVRGPTGLFELEVEKSADLINWTPIISHVTSEPGPAFYRFRFSR